MNVLVGNGEYFEKVVGYFESKEEVFKVLRITRDLYQRYHLYRKLLSIEKEEPYDSRLNPLKSYSSGAIINPNLMVILEDLEKLGFKMPESGYFSMSAPYVRDSLVQYGCTSRDGMRLLDLFDIIVGKPDTILSRKAGLSKLCGSIPESAKEFNYIRNLFVWPDERSLERLLRDGRGNRGSPSKCLRSRVRKFMWKFGPVESPMYLLGWNLLFTYNARDDIHAFVKKINDRISRLTVQDLSHDYGTLTYGLPSSHISFYRYMVPEDKIVDLVRRNTTWCLYDIHRDSVV